MKEKEQAELFAQYAKQFGEPFPAVEINSGQWNTVARECLRLGKPVAVLYRVEQADYV